MIVGNYEKEIFHDRTSLCGSICIWPNVGVQSLNGRAARLLSWLSVNSVVGSRGRFMLSLGLRARCTPSLLALTPSSVFVTRHISRWPTRRFRTPPPHHHRSHVTGGPRSFAAYSIAIAFGAGVGLIAYEKYQPFRHTVLAVVRCYRVAGE